jgi:hypothetical protein
VVAVAIWPRADASLVGDLAASACAPWRDRTDGVFPAAAPAENESCHALRAFLAQHRVPLRSVADYDAWRLRTGMSNVAKVLLFWAASMGSLYLFGWAGASISGRFLRRRQAALAAAAAAGGAAANDVRQ